MRTKKAMINFAWNLLQQLVNILTNIIVPILFIETYGSTVNGLYVSVKQIISYLNIVEAGVAMSATQALYKPLIQEDVNSVNAILSATKKFYLRSGVLFASLIATFTLFYPLFINDKLSKEFVYSVILILGITSIVEFLVAGKYRVLFFADQTNYIVSIGQVAGYSINTLICISLIKAGYGFLTVLIFSTIAYVIVRLGLLVYFAKKLYPSYRFNVSPDFNAISARWDALIHQVAGLVITNTPFLLLTLFGSLKNVSVYSVYFLLFGGVSVLLSTFSNGLASGFGEVLVKNDDVALQRGFNDFEYIFYIIMTLIYTCTIILVVPFVSIYTQNAHDANYVDLIIALQFMFIGLANNIRVPTMTLVVAAGHFKQTRVRAILEAIINITFSLIFTYFWGIYGVLMGSICSYLYRTVDFVIYGNRVILMRNPTRSIIRVLRNFLLGSIIAVPLMLIDFVRITSWINWLEYAICISALVFVVVVGGNSLFEIRQTKEVLRRILNLYKSFKPRKGETENGLLNSQNWRT